MLKLSGSVVQNFNSTYTDLDGDYWSGVWSMNSILFTSDSEWALVLEANNTYTVYSLSLIHI